MSLNNKYFILFLTIFIVEVLIALYVRDTFVRPYLGDILVVILLFCGAKSFVKTRSISIAIMVLVFAFFIEFLQYINFVERVGLSQYAIARVVIGTSFSWEDMLCYTVGFLLSLLLSLFLE